LNRTVKLNAIKKIKSISYAPGIGIILNQPPEMFAGTFIILLLKLNITPEKTNLGVFRLLTQLAVSPLIIAGTQQFINRAGANFKHSRIKNKTNQKK